MIAVEGVHDVSPIHFNEAQLNSKKNYEVLFSDLLFDQISAVKIVPTSIHPTLMSANVTNQCSGTGLGDMVIQFI